jgi:hypothetical protein
LPDSVLYQRIKAIIPPTIAPISNPPVVHQKARYGKHDLGIDRQTRPGIFKNTRQTSARSRFMRKKNALTVAVVMTPDKSWRFLP